MPEFKFPTPISELQDCTPHRGAMAWIDEVLSVTPEEGECGVHLRADAHYMNQDGIRPSSMIEWMAQSYGYIRACQIQMQARGGQAAPTKGYLVSVRNAEIADPRDFPSEGKIIVHCKRQRDLGPLSLFEGKVRTVEGKLLAKATIKVFVE